jgi:hypothetical protein
MAFKQIGYGAGKQRQSSDAHAESRFHEPGITYPDLV